MIEHKPWIGSDYINQILKIALVGFSHWGDIAADHENITREVVGSWAKGDENKPFAPRLRSYFGDEPPEIFWRKVAFFNTLPSIVGAEDERYADGAPEQRARAPKRVVELAESLKPDRILVFSKKAWKLWPDYTGSLKDGTLRIDDVGEFDCGTYTHPDGEAAAFGFPHPQYARTDDMKAAVANALAFDPAHARRGELE